jgi:NitT/TauT family transport system substrate-binding protein
LKEKKMKKMKKILTILTALTLAAGCLAGCGNTAADTQKESEAAEQTEAEEKEAETAEAESPAEEEAPAETETVDVSDLTLAAPAGAPALAVAALAVENPDQFTFVNAETITAEFSNGSADFIIAPLNAGAKLYKAGKSTYKLGAVISWGNLFFASQKENFSLEDINGGDITLFGENTINSSVALYALSENGIEPANVAYLAAASETQSLLLSDPEAIVMTAEPALTAARMKNDAITAYAVNDLYKKASGSDGYAQAALFIKAETIESQPEKVDAFLQLVQEAAGKCESDIDAVAQAAADLEILPNAKVAAAAIPGCAIRFMSAADAREEIEKTAEIDLSQFGGGVPSDDFYYGAE